MASKPIGAAAEAAARIIGGLVVPNEGTASIAAVPSVVVPNNPERAVLYILNMSASQLYLSPDNNVATGEGILLPPNGGSLSMVVTEDFQLVSSTWWAIGPGGPDNIYFVEMIRETAFEVAE